MDVYEWSTVYCWSAVVQQLILHKLHTQVKHGRFVLNCCFLFYFPYCRGLLRLVVYNQNFSNYEWRKELAMCRRKRTRERFAIDACVHVEWAKTQSRSHNRNANMHLRAAFDRIENDMKMRNVCVRQKFLWGVCGCECWTYSWMYCYYWVSKWIDKWASVALLLLALRLTIHWMHFVSM